jgi:uncharacterized membrane protein
MLFVGWASIDFLLGVYGKYHDPSESTYTMFWSRKEWLWVHLTGGAGALTLGAIQFATQSLQSLRRLHRWMGRVYMAFVALGCAGAAGLISTSPAPTVISSAFVGTALAWAITAAAGWAAIRAGQVVAHRRWMVRNFLVTLAPITFRLLIEIPAVQAAGLSPAAISGWLTVSWLLPLLVAEAAFRVVDASWGRKRPSVLAGSKL